MTNSAPCQTCVCTLCLPTHARQNTLAKCAGQRCVHTLNEVDRQYRRSLFSEPISIAPRGSTLSVHNHKFTIIIDQSLLSLMWASQSRDSTTGTLFRHK